MIAFSGHLQLRAGVTANARTTLTAQSFRAPFHLSKPYWDEDTRTLLVHVVNPTAGILSGDQLFSEISVDSGASLLVTTPSASRVFTMTEGTATSRASFTVAQGGWLEVSPEPLVLHRASRYRQTTQIDVASGGGLYFVDQLMPGRVGHGEAWSWSELSLSLEVRVAGELILHERFQPSGPGLKALAEHARTGPKACFANAVLVTPTPLGEGSWRTALASLHRDGTWIGVSALRRTGWALKVVAPDAIRLRQTLHDARNLLAEHLPSLRTPFRKL